MYYNNLTSKFFVKTTRILIRKCWNIAHFYFYCRIENKLIIGIYMNTCSVAVSVSRVTFILTRKCFVIHQIHQNYGINSYLDYWRHLLFGSVLINYKMTWIFYLQQLVHIEMLKTILLSRKKKAKTNAISQTFLI